MADLLMPVDLSPVHVSKVSDGFCHSGVYFLFHKGEVVYVGQSSSVLRRIGEHMSDCTKRFDAVASIPCQALNRLWMEAQYIERLKPRYNRPDLAAETTKPAKRRSSNVRKARARRRRAMIEQQSLVYQAQERFEQL